MAEADLNERPQDGLDQDVVSRAPAARPTLRRTLPLETALPTFRRGRMWSCCLGRQPLCRRRKCLFRLRHGAGDADISRPGASVLKADTKAMGRRETPAGKSHRSWSGPLA